MSIDVWADADSARLEHQQRQARNNGHQSAADRTDLSRWKENALIAHEREVAQRQPRHRLDVDPATLIADAFARRGEQ